jgi:O-antigen biosynthesis protein WbqP
LKRIIDILLGVFFSLIFLPLIIIISILIKLDSEGPIFFISDRIGKNSQNFKMIKFRTMFLNTEVVETSKLQNANFKITKIGKTLRKYSIDEIPQFFNVIIGNMSIVGPRPALPQQIELIEKRKKVGIDKIKPGITGYAQVNGRDLISDTKKLDLEIEYLKKKNFYVDLMIIFKTLKVVFNKIGISH